MSKRILFVEDETSARGIMAGALRGAGWQVEEAQDGEEGLAKLQNSPGAFDLVISDVSMPSMTGPEMLQAAEMALGAAKILLISGYAQPGGGLLAGRPVSFLGQPVAAPDLLKRVRELMEP